MAGVCVGSDRPGSNKPPVRLIGADTVVPCVAGPPRRYVNLDYAASTPVMAAVWDAVEAFVPWYSSVHRGSGLKSQVSTGAFEDARDAVAEFVGARVEDAVVFVRNTTEAINVLSAALPAGARVLASPVEHHSNLLPWRRHDLRLLPFTRSPDELLDRCDAALRSARPGIDLLAVTGASNVTGEMWPIAELAELSHAHGAQLFVDAAQLAPHRPIDMAGAGIDWLAFSGHKLYAPFGAGALVGDARPLCEQSAAAARRRRDRARDTGRRDLGGRSRAPRGGLTQRGRRRWRSPRLAGALLELGMDDCRRA